MDCGPDGKAFRRLNAIHLLLVGGSFELVLRNSRVKERTLRLWISRFNSMGIDGLAYRPHTGRPRKMQPAQVVSDILTVVDDPSLAQQTHWTLTKLCGWLRDEKSIELSYRTLVRYAIFGIEGLVLRGMTVPGGSLDDDESGKFSGDLLLHLNICEYNPANNPQIENKSSAAFNPGPANLQPISGKLYVHRQFAPVDDAGKDIFEEMVKNAVQEAVYFFDGWDVYRAFTGEIHCASNVIRSIPATPWWEKIDDEP